jgi:hypothetical protein
MRGISPPNPAFLVFLFIEGILLTMEKICKNCDYFVQISLDSGKDLFGDCHEPTRKEVSINEEPSFTWGDKTCPNFKPKRKTE